MLGKASRPGRPQGIVSVSSRGDPLRSPFPGDRCALKRELAIMSTSTITNSTTTGEVAHGGYPPRQTLIVWSIVLTLFVIAVGMRLYGLGLPFDRDGYDEGVYWQSLLAMHSGQSLYQQIFYSQPPFFLLSLYPSFVLFGSTLWSARFGVALVSLFGLLGAFLLGKALSGRSGAVLALLLLVVDPYFLLESQTIQAESSSMAFSILAVGLAYLWWEHPEGALGLCWAALTGVALALGILCKLLAVISLVPIALLVLARLWQIWRKQPGTSLASLRPLLVSIAACVVTMLLVLLPFLASYRSVLDEVVGFHVQSAAVFSRLGNTSMIGTVLVSVLGLTAFYGTLVALLRGDWRVIPLIAWLLATVLMLWRLAPLLPHHLVALTPPLVALTVMGVSIRKNLPLRAGMPAGTTCSINRPHDKSVGYSTGGQVTSRLWSSWTTLIALLLILITVVFDVQRDAVYYDMMKMNSVSALNQLQVDVAADLRQAITPDQLVVTDAQFIAGLAHRRAPSSLVDTSTVRINDGSLTLQQLIDGASQPEVHAVLFFSLRFYLPKVAAFHAWVAHHFRLVRVYGSRRELWVR